MIMPLFRRTYDRRELTSHNEDELSVSWYWEQLLGTHSQEIWQAYLSSFVHGYADRNVGLDGFGRVLQQPARC